MKIRTKYSPRKIVVSPSGTFSLTDSQFAKDCDILTIMKRCACGDSSMVRQSKPVFGDVSNYGDFAECMQKVAKAKMEFAELPSHIRSRFGDSPVALLEFLADSNNDTEAIRLGLKVAPPKPKVETVEPPKTEVVTVEPPKTEVVTPIA